MKAVAEKDMISKPCTVLRYNVEETTYEDFVNENKVEFDMVFAQPAKVNVKEEYLIYDLISFVGVIGGTMGLCIGFSFRDCAKWGLTYVEKAVVWMLDTPLIQKKIGPRNGKRSRKKY